MRRVLQSISGLALIGVVLPPILFLMGRLELDGCNQAMLLATVVWFIVTPFWMGREDVVPHEETVV